MKRLSALVLAFACLLGSAHAQGIVTTQPLPVTSVMSAGAMPATGTFAQAIAASANRKGCQLQNTSANTLYIRVGTTTITTPSAIQLLTKQTFDCAKGPVVITDQISVSGVIGDTFVTVRQ